MRVIHRREPCAKLRTLKARFRKKPTPFQVGASPATLDRIQLFALPAMRLFVHILRTVKIGRFQAVFVTGPVRIGRDKPSTASREEGAPPRRRKRSSE
jgi:hypothetical protein